MTSLEKEVDRHYNLMLDMIKENEQFFKSDIRLILGGSNLANEGQYLVAKLALLISGEGFTPCDSYYRKEFNKFLNHMQLKIKTSWR